MSYQPKADEIKTLREETSAPMMDCRKALVEAGGRSRRRPKALLLERGAARPRRRPSARPTKGLVASYIHAGGKIGVLVEVNSETDFVARNPKFAELVARHRDAHRRDVAAVSRSRERSGRRHRESARRSFARASRPESRPRSRRRSSKASSTNGSRSTCLLDQPFVKDDSMSVGELINGAVGSLGENIRVRRFAKFALGENRT